MTYFVMNIFFLVPVLLVGFAMRRRLAWRPILLATAVLQVITAIFDNVIIGTGIVAYDENLISGIKIGLAPIEDFAYSIAAPLLIAIIGELLKIYKGEPYKGKGV